MNYEEFCDEVKKGLVEKEEWNFSESDYKFYPDGFTSTDTNDLEFIRDTNIKYNHVESDVLQGDFIYLHVPDTGVYCRFSLTYLYKEFQEDDWDWVWNIIDQNIKSATVADTEDTINNMSDYELTRDKLIIRPINFTDNRYELKDTVYKQVGDIALTLYVVLYNTEEIGLGSVKVPKNIFDSWNIPLDEVWETAMLNTYLMSPPRIYKEVTDLINPPYEKGAFMALNSTIKHIGKLQVPTVTTTSKLNGAIAMFYPGVMKKLAELYDSSYYIAFTGISDVKLHCEGSISPRIILQNIKDMNKAFPDELLSRKVYHYNKDTGELKVLEL